MDAADAGMADAPVLPPDVSPPSLAGSGSAFPIAVVIAIGFMVTSLILIAYYFLVVRCWLRGGGGLLHRSRRGEDVVERVSAVFFTDYEADLPGGLDPDVVAALPVVKFRRHARSASAALECAVCLAEFAPDERLKQLPTCGHAFHIDCIDTWLHHNVSCPLCRTVVTEGVPVVARDDHEAFHVVGDSRRIISAAAARMEFGRSCRFPATTKSGGAAQQGPITRSFSMDCFVGDMGRKPPPRKEPAGSSEAGPSRADLAAGSSSSSNLTAANTPGETSGRFRRLLSSFGLGRSSRSTVLPIHLDP
ncbi:hypothetical protein PR202_ga27043 [Eleusine coracana subsp. coracana]|uniref:RING-type E3 ubiquitin transferase n=1 Tax=Eleusine coracana subsp. coracana TaxID=191504 RepID=A0AAV5DG50_ELECO|nr:hypothetical protein QOZ80_3AG0233940 [Eleusine coracana subsp. coracana]GJN09072.1 hypothetical protein PR202_ga27043 [Eleusine coracana subsp. coracana]